MSGVFDETIVPAGWFDETAQPLGWFDETELGSTGAAAVTTAGFSSWVFLQPFGFGIRGDDQIDVIVHRDVIELVAHPL